MSAACTFSLRIITLGEKIHGENLKAEDYTVETWTKFELALGDAEKTLADSRATQAEIDSQLNALQKAYDGLVKTEVPPVEKPSKGELKDLVAKAEALDTTGKTPESVQALADAIASAKDVLAKDDATEDEIKAAYDKLAAAIDGLKDAEQGGNGGSGNGGNNGNGGSGGNGGPGNQGSGGNNGAAGGSGSNGSGLPQTGDPAAVAVAGTGLIGSAAAALGAFFHRRRNR